MCCKRCDNRMVPMKPPHPAANGKDAITIRPCVSHSDFHECVNLQIAVWNFDPLEVVSSHILVVAAETGGQVLGAFEGERMIGFAQAFAAGRERKLYLHSHMVAVLPECQNRGIGRMLKIAQRDDALARGIDRIEWTFDPLQTLNAYFNIMKLGAIIRRYIPDFYGPSSSPLHANLPTDRVVAEWPLKSQRVERKLANAVESPPRGISVAIPRDFSNLRKGELSRAAEIQANIRSELIRRFAEGYMVTGFSVDDKQGNYLLEKSYED